MTKSLNYKMENQLKLIQLQQDRNFFTMIIILGVIFNYIAFSSNGFQMPVKTEYHFNDGFHFSYQDSSEVKLGLLTDIFNIKNIIVFSIGDVIIVLGMISLFVNQFKVFRRRNVKQ